MFGFRKKPPVGNPTGYKTTMVINFVNKETCTLQRMLWDIGQGDFVWDPQYHERMAFRDILEWFDNPNKETIVLTLNNNVTCLNKKHITMISIDSSEIYSSPPDKIMMPVPD